MKKQMYRQGDVLIERVSTKPAGKLVPREGGRVILAHGEVTGHAHAIASQGAALYRDNGVTTLEITEAMAALKHEEHATIDLPKGIYQVTRQREYSPEAIRNVAD